MYNLHSIYEVMTGQFERNEILSRRKDRLNRYIEKQSLQKEKVYYK